MGRRSEEAVVEDPAIMGGEPCLRGTRIPAYMVADMRAAGVTVDEILKRYPTLTRDLIEDACAYAEAHPVRRPPTEPTWRKTEPIKRVIIPRRDRSKRD